MDIKTRVRRGSETHYEIVADEGEYDGLVLGAFDICPEHGVEMAYGVLPTEAELEQAKTIKPDTSKRAENLRKVLAEDLERRHGPEARKIFEQLVERYAK